MNTLKPVSRTNLSEQVALQIVQMISAARWKPGEKLPAESQLCKVFQVGRSSLREALKSLAFVGVVRMRAGEGTYVEETPSKFIDRVLAHGLLNTQKDVDDLSETRIALETELVALCAERATAEDLQGLGDLVKVMHGPLPGGNEQFLDLDVRFHLSIATASKNPVLSQLLQTIRDLLKELITKSLQVPGSREVACTQHSAILEAIRQRNPRKARTAMRNHLRTFQRAYKIILEASGPGRKPEEYSMATPERGK